MIPEPTPEDMALQERASAIEAAAKKLADACRPLARAVAGVPDNWPAECVLTWEERYRTGGSEDAPLKLDSITSYLSAEAACTGVTIGEYRAAAAALAEYERTVKP